MTLQAVFRFLLITVCLLAGCVMSLAAQEVDSIQLMSDLRELSSDKYEGRKPGTKGGELAQNFLMKRFMQTGLSEYHHQFKQRIVVLGDKIDRKGPDSISNYKQVRGANIIGYIPGKKPGVIVISAHFDHLGIIDGYIYNGADDNASGTCALLGIAAHFVKNPPEHTLIFAAFDAEEIFMRGSLGFINNLPVPLDDILLNVNMDLMGTSADWKLYAGGTFYERSFKPFLNKVWKDNNKKFSLHFGYDVPGAPEDRTYRSDHGVFHLAGIPFLYFGVPEHKNYHQPTDDFENISHSFYYNSVKIILKSIIEIDKNYPF